MLTINFKVLLETWHSTVGIIIHNAHLCSDLVVKRWPSGSGIVFVSRRVEGIIADDTFVYSMFMVVVTRRKWPV